MYISLIKVGVAKLICGRYFIEFKISLNIKKVFPEYRTLDYFMSLSSISFLKFEFFYMWCTKPSVQHVSNQGISFICFISFPHRNVWTCTYVYLSKMAMLYSVWKFSKISDFIIVVFSDIHLTHIETHGFLIHYFDT